MPKTYTPLRYPGGKTKLYDFISSVLSSNQMNGCTYVEPFAGGAGLAIKLLLKQKVERIIINDIDYAVYCVWDLIVNNSELLCEFINSVPLNVTEWQRQRAIYSNQDSYSPTEIGLSAFYLNRTNVSGVLKGGVIGGLSQEGTYKIDARFNRKALIDKVSAIAQRRECIDVYNWDARDFISNILPNYDNCFVYFDPPCVQKGPSLYRNSFSHRDHQYLYEIISDCPHRWIVTYDKCELISELYSDYASEVLSIKYSAGQTKSGDEIVIYGPGVLPAAPA